MDAKNKRIVGLSAAAGITVAVSLACALVYLHTHGLADTSGGRLLSNIGGYLWPSAILMMDVDRLTFDTLWVLVISATLNGFIYGLIAHCGYTLWKFVAGPKGDGWWPSKPDK